MEQELPLANMGEGLTEERGMKGMVSTEAKGNKWEEKDKEKENKKDDKERDKIKHMSRLISQFGKQNPLITN